MEAFPFVYGIAQISNTFKSYIFIYVFLVSNFKSTNEMFVFYLMKIFSQTPVKRLFVAFSKVFLIIFCKYVQGYYCNIECALLLYIGGMKDEK